MTRVIPPLAGILFIALFAKLGLWQLDRAAEKNALQDAWDNPNNYLWVSAEIEPEKFQALEVSGRYLEDRQILIDNIVRDGRLGYFVVTPFEYSANDPLLLVNRGWLARDRNAGGMPAIGIGKPEALVRGRAGDLPRVGIRPGEAFVAAGDWPRVAVWPTIDEVAAQLQQEVLPFVLLLDPEQADGFARNWQPRLAGASTHYGYAAQWFAMAAAVFAILVWFFRHGRATRER